MPDQAGATDVDAAFRVLGDVLPGPLLLLSLSGRVVAHNRAAARAFPALAAGGDPHLYEAVATTEDSARRFVAAAASTGTPIPWTLRPAHQTPAWRAYGSRIGGPEAQPARILVRWREGDDARRAFRMLTERLDESSREAHRRQEKAQALARANAELERRVAERTAELADTARRLDAELTERLRLERELRHLADHDPLTGLLNRRGFDRELERHLQRWRPSGPPSGALLVLDLDDFKQVNDRHGHQAGDALIRSAAQTIRGRLRGTDVVARLGGDEFAVLLPMADAEAARTVAHALSRDLRRCPARPVTASMGIALIDANRDTPARLLAEADAAMYAVKAARKDREAVGAPSTLAARAAPAGSS